MERACAFYRDVLGLKPGVQSPYWSDFELGDVKIGLHPPFVAGPGRPEAGWIVGVEVDDLLELRSVLATVGVKVGELHDVPGGVVLDFSDPDGNALQAIQRGQTKGDLEPE